MNSRKQCQKLCVNVRWKHHQLVERSANIMHLSICMNQIKNLIILNISKTRNSHFYEQEFVRKCVNSEVVINKNKLRVTCAGRLEITKKFLTNMPGGFYNIVLQSIFLYL